MTATAVQRLWGFAAAQERAAWMHRLLTIATFAGIYLILINVLHVDLIFSRTTAAGGDMGSHHYVAEFLREKLLPRGQVTGWAPGWFAGIPMLEFYFPLPYTLIALASPLLGEQVAFKLVTSLGLFALPLTCWGAFRVLRLREPAPLLAAVAAMPFLFITSYTIYGGNIASTMAGEFSFSISFALLPLAFAVLYRTVEEGRDWRPAALLVAAVVLCHILTTIVLVLGTTFFLLRAPGRAALATVRKLAWVFGAAFCITAFWSLPFLLHIQYTARFEWTQRTEFLGDLFPAELRPYMLMGIVGLLAAVRRRERRLLLFAWPGLLAAATYVVLEHFFPRAALWNARMLPFVYLFALLLAAWGTTVLIGMLVGLVHKLPPALAVDLRVAYACVMVLLIALPLLASWERRDYPSVPVEGWAKYNYEGFEVKQGWPEARALFDTLRGLPRGRVLWEYHKDYEKYGTTRTLENMPVFAGQPTMEGLLIESSLNAPFHFIMQAETSEQATHAVPGVEYPGFDFPVGLQHMRIFGIRYYVAYTETTKQAARAAGLREVTRTGPFVIYQAGEGHLVEVPRYRPVLAPTRDWRSTSLEWFRRPQLLDTHLVYASRDDAAAREAFVDAGEIGPGRLPATLPREELARPGPVTEVTDDLDRGVLEFTTDRVGEPHVVKVSWFPGWTAEGAEGPWMLSPGLMVVVPTQAHVRLTYQDSPAHLAGKGLTLAGLGVLALPPALRRLRRRRA